MSACWASAGDNAYLEHEGVGGDANMKGIGLRPALPLLLALLGAAVVREQLEGRAPLLELDLPVQHDAGGYDDQMRTPHSPAAQES